MYLDCLVILFEAVANMIDRQESTVEYFYGPGSMLTVIQRFLLFLRKSLIRVQATA